MTTHDQSFRRWGIGDDHLAHPNRAQRWGSRKLLVRGPASIPQSVSGQVTFVDTPTFDVPALFYVQVRFASVFLNDSGTPSPALPFQSNSSDRIKFVVRRQLDEYGGLITDEYIVNGFAPTTTETFWFPIAVVGARKLQILAEDIDANPGHGAQYVDVVAIPTTSIDDSLIIAERTSLVGSNIFGYANTDVQRIAATNASVTMLAANSARRQIFVTNEGDQRLALRFSALDTARFTVGNESWDVVLDPKGGAVTRYISGQDGYWGPVQGVWDGAAPTGFALISGSTVS